jgi:hypothetical protein
MPEIKYRKQIEAVLTLFETTDRHLTQICKDQGISIYTYRNYLQLDLELSSRHVIEADRRKKEMIKRAKKHFGTGYDKV